MYAPAVSAEATALRANRDFVLLWLAEATSGVGLQVAVVAYPLVVLALTGSAAAAGIVGFARTLPWLLFSVPAGALIDRLNRKRVMLGADAVASVALATIPVAVWLGSLSVTQVAIVAFVEGTCAVFFQIAETAAVRMVVPAEQLPDAIAANDARAYAARVAGTPIGGALLAASRALPFAADAFSYFASLVLVLATRKDFQEERSSLRRPRFAAEVAEGGRWLLAQPFLRTALVLVGGGNFAFAGVTLAVIVVAKEKDASPVLVGVMLAFGGVGGLIGAVAAPWLRRRVTPRLIVVGINWLDAGLFAAMALAPDALVLGVLLAAISFIGPTWNAVVDGYRISIIPDPLIGRVQSFDSLVAFGCASLGPLVAGLLLAGVGGDATFLLFAAFMLVLAFTSTILSALHEIDASHERTPTSA
jgi:predicted MFS family arabinose efflux permease